MLALAEYLKRDGLEIASLVAGLFIFTGAIEYWPQGFRSSDFVKWLLGDERADEVIGDLDEIYVYERERYGKASAVRRYALRLTGLVCRQFWRTAVRLVFRRNA